MVREYVTELYVPAAASSLALTDADGFGPARELAAWKRRVIDAWPQVRIEHVESEAVGSLGGSVGQRLGSALAVRVSLALGELTRDDVAVEVVYGRPDEDDEIVQPAYATLTAEVAETAEGAAEMDPAQSGTPVRCRSTGQGRSATRSACCRAIRCWTAAPSSGWSPTRRRRPA